MYSVLFLSIISVQCDNFVKTYGDDIVKLLLQFVSPKEVCTVLHLCQTTEKITAGPLCVLCELVMKELESVLNSNTTEATIKAALDKVCSALPSSIRTEVGCET